MRKTTRVTAVVLGLLLVPLSAIGQEETAQSFVYSTYFECDANEEWLVDAIVDQAFAPIYDAAVADGSITAWGVLAHHTGGQWRRATYHVASSIDALLDATVSVNQKIDAASPNAGAKFGEICYAHDDYIWRSVTGSGGAGSVEAATKPSTAGVSMYLVCDMAREDRADELVAAMAPAYDRAVADGRLVSWGWLEHVVGGKYRRLLTLRGADHKSNMAAWGSILDELAEQHGEALAEFAGICNSHQDYLWNVR